MNDMTYKPRTELGRRLVEIRQKALEGGMGTVGLNEFYEGMTKDGEVVRGILVYIHDTEGEPRCFIGVEYDYNGFYGVVHFKKLVEVNEDSVRELR